MAVLEKILTLRILQVYSVLSISDQNPRVGACGLSFTVDYKERGVARMPSGLADRLNGKKTPEVTSDKVLSVTSSLWIVLKLQGN